MRRQAIVGTVMLLLCGFVAVSAARADEWNDKTIITFSQPVEIPRHVLPAGTYTFQLLDTMSDRHIVQVFNADGKKLIATVMAISDYRLEPTGQTVIKFREMPAGEPEAIRAWFYPGNTVGQAFVYPKMRATQLAKAHGTPVPAVATESKESEMRTAAITAVTPEEKETPVASSIQTTPANDTTAAANPAPVTTMARNTRQLPRTASSVPLIGLLGLASLLLGLSLLFVARRVPVRVRVS